MADESILDLDDAGLVRELAVKQRALVEARFALSMNRLENTASIGGIRKAIARVRTEIRRREVAAGLSRDALVSQHRVDPRSLVGEAGGAKKGAFLSDVVDKLAD